MIKRRKIEFRSFKVNACEFWLFLNGRHQPTIDKGIEIQQINLYPYGVRELMPREDHGPLLIGEFAEYIIEKSGRGHYVFPVSFLTRDPHPIVVKVRLDEAEVNLIWNCVAGRKSSMRLLASPRIINRSRLHWLCEEIAEYPYGRPEWMSRIEIR